MKVAKSVLDHFIEGRVYVHASCDGSEIAFFRYHGVGDFLDKNGCFGTDDVGAEDFSCLLLNDDFHEAFREAQCRAHCRVFVVGVAD